MTSERGPEHTLLEIQRQRILMAAPFNVVLRGRDERMLREAALDVFQETHKREELLSRFLPDSEICILNHLAAHQPVRVEPRTFETLLRCREYWRWSAGALDITIAPLLDLWDVRGSGRTPTEAEIAQTMQAVGMDKVLFEEPSFLMAFAREGVALDLGGVGKGTGVDDALTALRRRWPVAEAYLSFGRSTIGVIGTWRVEILSPVDERRPVCAVELRDETLSMSTVGPRRFVHGAYQNEKVDHIIDPRTGRARADILSVTAIAPCAEAADALTTALVVLGEEKAPAVAARFGARQVIFVRPGEQGDVVRTLDAKKGTWDHTATSPGSGFMTE